MAVLDHIELPNGITYDISDASARKLDNNDFDTINVTELNAGDVIVTGAARFLNTINGDISGNAETATSATKATQDESGNNIKSTYANAISISDHTITLKNKNGTSLGTVTVPDNNTTYTVATGTANGKIKVTPSSGSAYEVGVYGLKSAAYKDVTDSYSATGTDPVSGKAVAAAIDGLPSPMVFRGSLGTGGTVTALPVDGTAKVGDTYKVITAGTYASKAAKVGDTFICLTKTSSANTWELIPSGDEPSGTVTSVAISNGGGLSVSGSPITSSGTITISHADTSSQASVDNSGRTYIQDISLDTYGHVTKISSATETVVNTDRYVNSAAFADATSADANNPVKMTLTRAGSDTASVTAYLPKVSSSSAGVAPKGAAVSSQSQTTKFLREDGTWAAPSYTTNTNTTYTIGTSDNKVTLTPSSGSVQSITVPYATSAGSATQDSDGNAINTTYFKLSGGTITGVPKFGSGSISAFSGNIPYILGIEAFTDGGDVKWKASDDVSVGYLTEADYTSTDYARHSTGSRLKAVLTRQNKCGIGTSSAGGLLLASNWTSNSFNAELYMGMGDNLCIYYRGVNSSTYTDWYPIGRFTQTTPTSGQVVITDGTTGGMKSSGYTIAKSVPSNADFTNTWRPVENVLTSTSTTNSLSAAQGKYLQEHKSEYRNIGTAQDYQRVVIALCEVSASASAGTNSHTSGTIATIRSNGLVGEYLAMFTFQDYYTTAKSATYSTMGNYQNTSTTARTGEGYRPCVFTYNSKHYAGLEFFQTQARAFYWYGEGNFEPFLVAYYNMNSSTVLNTEIDESITYSTDNLKKKDITVDGATNATSATTASKLGSSNVGSATQPIYLSAGTATACTYTLGKSVPSDAVFTDTKNTAGSTDTSSKIFLIGATSQATNPQTYSDNEVYATSGVLTTKSVQVGGGAATMEYDATTQSINFIFN